MKIEVEMLAFGNGAIREVDIPDKETEGKSQEEILDLVFYYGQNDFQPKQIQSVSCGDVVRLNDKRFRVATVGFEEVTDEGYSIKRVCSVCDALIGYKSGGNEPGLVSHGLCGDPECEKLFMKGEKRPK